MNKFFKLKQNNNNYTDVQMWTGYDKKAKEFYLTLAPVRRDGALVYCYPMDAKTIPLLSVGRYSKKAEQEAEQEAEQDINIYLNWLLKNKNLELLSE